LKINEYTWFSISHDSLLILGLPALGPQGAVISDLFYNNLPQMRS